MAAIKAARDRLRESSPAQAIDGIRNRGRHAMAVNLPERAQVSEKSGSLFHVQYGPTIAESLGGERRSLVATQCLIPCRPYVPPNRGDQLADRQHRRRIQPLIHESREVGNLFCWRKWALGINPRREMVMTGAGRSDRLSVRITSTAVKPLPIRRTGSSGPIWLSASGAQGSVTKRVRGPVQPFANGSLGGRCPTARMAKSA